MPNICWRKPGNLLCLRSGDAEKMCVTNDIHHTIVLYSKKTWSFKIYFICTVFSLKAQEKETASWFGCRGCQTTGNILQGEVDCMNNWLFCKRGICYHSSISLPDNHCSVLKWRHQWTFHHVVFRFISPLVSAKKSSVVPCVTFQTVALYIEWNVGQLDCWMVKQGWLCIEVIYISYILKQAWMWQRHTQ